MAFCGLAGVQIAGKGDLGQGLHSGIEGGWIAGEAGLGRLGADGAVGHGEKGDPRARDGDARHGIVAVAAGDLPERRGRGGGQ